MKENTTMRRWSLVGCCLLAVCLFAPGCGDSTGLAKRYAVSGTVTYNGQPLEDGNIEFQPTNYDTQRAATGLIKNGSYYLTTAIDGDGALPGEYLVTVRAKDPLDYSKAEANVQGGSLRQDDVAKAYMEAKDRIPTKYNVAQTSGLKYTVEERSNRNVDFALTD